MFDKLSDLDKRELRNTKTDLAVPHRKSAFGQKCFSYKGAKLWNDLSTKVKSSKTYEVFKNVSATSAVNASSLSPDIAIFILILVLIFNFNLSVY